MVAGPSSPTPEAQAEVPSTTVVSRRVAVAKAALDAAKSRAATDEELLPLRTELSYQESLLESLENIEKKERLDTQPKPRHQGLSALAP